MSQASGCSALEDLAAFAEGRLHGAERERMITHLAGCADCREVLADSMETTEDLVAEGAVAPVVELRPADRRRRWLSSAAGLAAAAVVAAGAVVLWQANARRSPPDRGEWLAALPADELAPHVWGGVVLRGGEGDYENQARRAIELGALLVDVDVALAAGDAERARDFLHRMATICEEAGFMVEEETAALRTIAEMGDTAVMRTRLSELRPALEPHLRERFDPIFLDLGTFLNEAQLAARTGRTDFLDAPHARRFLDWVLSQGDERLPDELLSRLELRRRESSMTYEKHQQVIAEVLEPVRNELLALRNPESTATACAQAAEQALDALTH